MYMKYALTPSVSRHAMQRPQGGEHARRTDEQDGPHERDRLLARARRETHLAPRWLLESIPRSLPFPSPCSVMVHALLSPPAADLETAMFSRLSRRPRYGHAIQQMLFAATRQLPARELHGSGGSRLALTGTRAGRRSSCAPCRRERACRAPSSVLAPCASMCPPGISSWIRLAQDVSLLDLSAPLGRSG